MTAVITADPMRATADFWRETFEATASGWLQLATASVAAGAAMSDAWMQAAAASLGVLANASRAMPTPPDASDPWAAMRAAWIASADPWRPWMPFLRFELP